MGQSKQQSGGDRASRVWRGALLFLTLAAITASCSSSQCKDMKGGGNAFASLVCGGEGDVPEEPPAPKRLCKDARLVMPEFFKLIDDPNKPLGTLRTAVGEIGAPICQDPIDQRRCTPGNQGCELGECVADSSSPTGGLCPCKNAESPLGDLLVVLFKGLSSVADPNKPAEPGAVDKSRCAPPALVSALTDATRNELCEVRRTLDFLLAQNGGGKLFNDPNVVKSLTAFLDYVQGKGYASAHYDLFTTLGKASNLGQPGAICDASNTYALLDLALGYLTPPTASALVGHVKDLLADPTMVQFLNSVSSGSGSGSATGRAAVITLARSLLPGLVAAKNQAEALQQIDDLVSKLILAPAANYPQTFKNHVKAVLDDVHALLNYCRPGCGTTCTSACAADKPLFPDVQRLLSCLNSPAVDPDGTLVGALYDLLSLKPLQPGVAGVDLPTLLGAIQAIVDLDTSGQVVRLLRYLITSIGNDEVATEAVRALLAEALTPEVGKNLVPALSVLVQHQVLGEVLALLQDILYGCTPPATP
jgi:hypothetical protein